MAFGPKAVHAAFEIVLNQLLPSIASLPQYPCSSTTSAPLRSDLQGLCFSSCENDRIVPAALGSSALQGKDSRARADILLLVTAAVLVWGAGVSEGFLSHPPARGSMRPGGTEPGGALCPGPCRDPRDNRSACAGTRGTEAQRAGARGQRGGLEESGGELRSSPAFPYLPPTQSQISALLHISPERLSTAFSSPPAPTP